MNALVLDARQKLDALVEAEFRCPGDMVAALNRLARQLHVPYGALWALRYRPPKDVKGSVYLKLCRAHEALRGTAERAHQDERSQEAPKTMVGRALVGLAAAVDRANFADLDGDGRGASA